jgi:type III pantothenate kinase
MILTIDVGNTNIVLSVYDGDVIKFTSRLATQASKMEDEYAIDFINILRLYSCEDNEFEGAIISSVVPQIMPALMSAVKTVFRCRVMSVSAGIKTGLNIKIENPVTLGADLVCGAVAALKKYPMPCIIFDLGTAITVTALDSNGAFLGGSIFPGVNASMQALTSSTAQLPYINTSEGEIRTIGANTADSMRSGIIIGTACMIDGMIDRYKEELGEDATVVVTGGISSMIVQYCKKKVILDKTLLSDGLLMLYKMNSKKS